VVTLYTTCIFFTSMQVSHRFSENSVTTYKTTWRHHPGDHDRRLHCHENLKSKTDYSLRCSQEPATELYSEPADSWIQTTFSHPVSLRSVLNYCLRYQRQSLRSVLFPSGLSTKIWYAVLTSNGLIRHGEENKLQKLHYVVVNKWIPSQNTN
jgi:hypothetical protein